MFVVAKFEYDSAFLCYTLPMLTFGYEISLSRRSGAVICGVDEAELRSLAGPVIACASILPLTGLSIFVNARPTYS